MERDLVFDIGAYQGEDTAYYLRRGFRVVAVEANPESADACRQRFHAEISAGRLVMLNVGIAAEDGVVTFFLSEGNQGRWSSLDPALASRENVSARPVTVQARSLRSLLREYGVPYYLKVDIQGAEHLCLRDIDRTDAPSYVSFAATDGRLEDLFLLARAGYTRFKLIDQVAAFRQVMPPPLHSAALATTILSRLAKKQLRQVPGLVGAVGLVRQARARANGHPQLSARPELSISSSGPMAEETDGPWRSVDEVAYAWLHYVGATTISNWYDVHAAR
jgi:FkbM family methyltransferase